MDFYRDWAQYKRGFGDVNGEFWLGNDYIHILTKRHDQKLKIELTYNGEVKYADYSTFWIENEAQKYRLTESGFSGSTPPGGFIDFSHPNSLLYFVQPKVNLNMRYQSFFKDIKIQCKCD